MTIVPIKTALPVLTVETTGGRAAGWPGGDLRPTGGRAAGRVASGPGAGRERAETFGRRPTGGRAAGSPAGRERADILRNSDFLFDFRECAAILE
jgi:hypothetical protein